MHEESQPPVDIAVPVLTDVLAANGTDTIVLTFSKPIYRGFISPALFNLSVGSVTSVAVSGANVILTTQLITSTEISVAYSLGTSGLESTLRLKLSSFNTVIPVRKIVGANITSVNVSLQGTGADTIYTGVGPAWGSGFEFTSFIPANKDGYIIARQLDGTQSVAEGFATASGPVSYALPYGVFLHSAGFYYLLTGVLITPNVTGASNDEVRVSRTSGVIKAERRPVNSSMWIPIYTYPGTYFGPLYPQVWFTYPNTSKATNVYVGGA
jgi:hypothetical protein